MDNQNQNQDPNQDPNQNPHSDSPQSKPTQEDYDYQPYEAYQAEEEKKQTEAKQDSNPDSPPDPHSNPYWRQTQNANSSWNETGSEADNQNHGPFYQQAGATRQPTPRPRPANRNGLAIAAFVLSILSYLLCCCNPYLLLMGSVIALTLSICSRFFYNPLRRLHGLAIAAMIISILGLLLVIGILLLNYVMLPYLMETDPAFREYYNNMYEQLMEQLEGVFLFYHP